MTINRRLVAVLLPALVLAGCSSTVDGTGSTTSGPTSAGTSTPDFPSGASSATTQSTSAPSTSTPTGSTHPVPATPLRTATVHASGGRTYVVKVWAEVSDPTCFDHAYGTAMITFLTKHPCRGLRRLLATTTVGGRGVGFAESSTGFDGTPQDPYVYATEFRKLELANNTGSIKDLFMEGYRLPAGPTAVPDSEAFNVVGQDSGVTVWDAWYLDGPTPDGDKALIRMTEELFLQF